MTRSGGEIALTFTPAHDGCLLQFEHGGWTDGTVTDRHKFSDWPLILDRFAALANSPHP